MGSVRDKGDSDSQLDGWLIPTDDTVFLTLTIDGEPHSKERPRRGRGGHFYTPKTTVDAEKHIKELASAYLIEPNSTDLFVVWLSFLTGSKVKDLDNQVKLVLDAFNKTVWKDDSQVIEIRARLTRSKAIPPHTKVTVFTVSEQMKLLVA